MPWSKKKDELFIRGAYFLLRKIFGPIVKLIWVKETIGTENIPKKGPVIIAFNHESYLDFLCFIAVSRRPIHYLAAEKFFSNKYWRIIMYLTGQIEVKRNNKNKTALHDLVFGNFNEGKMLGVFPEGTRSPFKDEILKALPGFVKLAIRGKVPVVPVGLYGTYDIMSRHDKVPKFKKCVLINIGEPIHLDKFYNGHLSKEEYELIANKIMLRISKLSGKKYPYYQGSLDF